MKGVVGEYMSFVDCVTQIVQNPTLLVSTVLILGVILVNGRTDAPNAVATCVSTRAIGVAKTIIMAAVFTFFDVFVLTAMNSKVAYIIYNMVDFGHEISFDCLMCGNGGYRYLDNGGWVFRYSDKREPCNSFRE